MFNFLFSCCVRQRRRDPTVPDERTFLIPATTISETPTQVPQPRVVDHQKLKERLGTVVRSKEGKMVNVNAAFPFNLHNQSLGDPPSRSVSGGTLDSSRHASRSPARHSLHTRHSSTSLQRDAEGSASQSNDAVEGRGDPQKPILNVRLVSTPVSNGANRAINSISRGRPGRGIEHGRVMVVNADHISHPDEDVEEHDHVAEDSDALTPCPQTQMSEGDADKLSDTDPSKPSPDVNVIHTEDFTIRDAGAISRSWGD
ncbi:hypothetical protein DFJ58DRAFT_854346 [Suillus subalutaceus]|uniref:uncharacterized protein n=1 Tax=Suillus subalutaceus TaxID=48586 RepID=UPI001B86391D|nr:uncharacterized protein DFJ58DRAFT_854346 [Suillus subalutaceus]KAG1870253.1 hypothetical protein DFJ58DRAFT_854346 [Suillus subalutaceus]